MEPVPAPTVPGNTEAERMDAAVRKMFTVSKEDIVKREAEWKHDREQEQKKKKRVKKAN